MLTPVENNAFNELARQLAARLDSENGNTRRDHRGTPSAPETVIGQPAAPDAPEAVSDQPDWLVHPEPPARGETRRDRTLLDLLPVGVLIYRLDRLLYANPAFLDADGLSEPSRAGASRRSRRALCRARRLHRQQHIGHRHAGDDFRDPGFAGTRAAHRRPTRGCTRSHGTTIPRWP